MSSFLLELRQLPRLVSESARELHNLRSLVGTALLIALSVVINQFTIVISTTFELSLSFLPEAVAGMLFGPVVTGVGCIAADLVKFAFLPNGGFSIAFTFTEFLTGFIFGCVFYHKQITAARAVGAQLLVMIFINLTLTPLILSVMYGSPFWPSLPPRIIRNVFFIWPIYSFLMYVVCKAVSSRRLYPAR